MVYHRSDDFATGIDQQRGGGFATFLLPGATKRGQRQRSTGRVGFRQNHAIRQGDTQWKTVQALGGRTGQNSPQPVEPRTVTGTDKASGLTVPVEETLQMGAGVGDGEQPLAAVDQPESAPALMQGTAASLGQFSKRPDIDDPSRRSRPFRRGKLNRSAMPSSCRAATARGIVHSHCRKPRRGRAGQVGESLLIN